MDAPRERVRPMTYPPQSSLRPPIPRKESGFTLIEVMVSLLIFSLGVLGMVAMQTKAITYAVDAEDRSRAALLASELVAAMWAEGTNNPTIYSNGTWQTHVADVTKSGLPNGLGTVEPTTDSSTQIKTTKVTITWRAPSKASTEKNTYFTQVVIP